jgi:hypothetical protein
MQLWYSTDFGVLLICICEEDVAAEIRGLCKLSHNFDLVVNWKMFIQRVFEK